MEREIDLDALREKKNRGEKDSSSFHEEGLELASQAEAWAKKLSDDELTQTLKDLNERSRKMVQGENVVWTKEDRARQHQAEEELHRRKVERGEVGKGPSLANLRSAINKS